ncbi:MAG: sigma-70 family RNA polymerase sigma factor [Micromonosporaceae bacterium]|nr:sigma-70 family RNA polymerase sigma factor [Micromonosporaceae bacterium]
MTPPPGDPPSAAAPQLSDPELIGAVRAGDPDAFATLYTRHVAAARRLALALTRHQSDADDLVAEGFARLLGTLRDGGGPNVAFRAYLLTTVRNLFYDRTRRERRVNLTADLSNHDAGVPFEDTALAGLERTLVARAFARLPERWQTVLWHTEVEGDSPAAIAPILDLTPNGVSALAYRARERLRQNYLREHVATSPTTECQTTVDRLGAYVRSGLAQRERTAVDDHLSGCRRCQVLYLELGDVNASLRSLLAPVVLGEVVAAAYLGGSSAGGFAAFLHPVWSNAKRISRRRSTQAGAGAVVVAAALALALVLTSGGPAPEPDPDPPAGPGPGPGAAPGPPAADQPPDDQPGPGEPGAGPGGPGAPAGGPGAGAPGGVPPTSPPDEPIAMAVTLEPVGELVRDRPGVLAMTVTASDDDRDGGTGGQGGGTSGGTGGQGGEAASTVATVGWPAGLLAAQPSGETGRLTALVTVPDGVSLRAGNPGDGWSCDGPVGDGFRCRRGSLPAGGTSQAYLPVDVSATAGVSGTSRVRLTAPGIEATSAAAPRGVQGDGFAARIAGVMPATVLAGGDSLLSCPPLDLTCGSARRGGGALGRIDNDDYLMTRYAERGAPAGFPSQSSVSGATIRLPGPVVWAGLYWAGSGEPPGSPTAHLRVPGRSGYTAVPATTVRTVGAGTLSHPAYQASADVTDLVRGGSGGDWWVAVDAHAFDRGRGAFGGWALLIVAEDGGSDRAVAVFDELTALRDETRSAGLFGNSGAARIGLVGWEGDRGLAGEQLRLDGAPLGGGDRDNLAGSRSDGNPTGWNTLGVDARVLGASVGGGGDQPTLTATSGRDAWLLGPVAVVTPGP